MLLLYICNMPAWALLLMFLEILAGVRSLILNDLAREVSPHSKEVLRQEVRIVPSFTDVPPTQQNTYFNTYFDLKVSFVYPLSFTNQKHKY